MGRADSSAQTTAGTTTPADTTRVSVNSAALVMNVIDLSKSISEQNLLSRLFQAGIFVF
jgi:hypothetical protein